MHVTCRLLEEQVLGPLAATEMLLFVILFCCGIYLFFVKKYLFFDR
jgi:hypothetical protein